MPAGPFKLYGMEASLYTARPRSYMRKNGVPFIEIAPGSQEFVAEILPATGRWIMPVMQTSDGQIIQDGADIIDHLDEAGYSKSPIYPGDPALLAIAHVFELFGSQGLLRAAMHYRWNFDEVNLNFIRDSFGDLIPTGLPKEGQEAVFLNASGRMREATKALGVNSDTKKLVEESYAQFLLLMNSHLEVYPYMLGGHATIADYGLIGAMYAHLGRDPVPLRLMQTDAPRVFRWVERMNMAEISFDRTLGQSSPELLKGDELPPSLLALLRFVADDYLPEIDAHVRFANNWLDDHPEVTKGTSTKEKIMRGSLGLASFSWRGATIESWVLPYRFYLLNRLLDAVERQDDEARAAIRDLFKRTGLESLLDTRTKRRMGRLDNHEAWGDLV